jgi:FixJ family two-component response regulator
MNAEIETRRKALVLVVDDDDLMRNSTRRLLRSAGFRVEAFASAEEFLLSGAADETACLILDVRMPGMNGVQLQRQMAAEGRRIPIIFITARENEDIRMEAMRAGAVDFLQKPFSEEALLNAVRKALETPPSEERKHHDHCY